MAYLERADSRRIEELITFNHTRSQRIEVSDAVDEARGIDSRLSPIETLILLAPPELLGTHEATIGDPSDPKFVPEGFDHSGFEEISFENGWAGPAVAIAASSPDLYAAISSAIRQKGVGLLDGFDYGDLGVLDGHHRKASAELGVIKLKYVPVQLIPFPSDPAVQLGTWHSDGVCWTADQVFECFKIPGKFADAKRTKFQIVGKDGNAHRILHMQPNVKIPLEDLL